MSSKKPGPQRANRQPINRYVQHSTEREVDLKNRIFEDINRAEENIQNMKDEYEVFIKKYVEHKDERNANDLIILAKRHNNAIDKYNEMPEIPKIRPKKRYIKIDIELMLKKYPSQLDQYKDFQMLAQDLLKHKTFIDEEIETGKSQFKSNINLKVLELISRLNHYSKGEGIIHEYELFDYESFDLGDCLGKIYNYHNNPSGEVGNISECWKHIDNMLKLSNQEILKVAKKEEEQSRIPTKEEKEEKEKEEFEEMETGLHELKKFIDEKFKTGEEPFNPESAERVKVLIEQLNKFSRGKYKGEFVPFDYDESFDLDNGCLETIKNYYFNPPMGQIRDDHELKIRKENELKLKNCYNNIMNILIKSQEEIKKAQSGAGRRHYKNHSKRKINTKKIQTNKKNSKKQKSKVASKKKQKSKVSSKKKQKSKTKKNNKRQHRSTLKR